MSQNLFFNLKWQSFYWKMWTFCTILTYNSIYLSYIQEVNTTVLQKNSPRGHLVVGGHRGCTRLIKLTTTAFLSNLPKKSFVSYLHSGISDFVAMDTCSIALITFMWWETPVSELIDWFSLVLSSETLISNTLIYV